MNYYLKTLLIFLVSSLIAGTSLAGGGISFATKYEITMLKMELCTDAPLVSETDVTCTGSVVLGTGNTVFDIASVLKNEAIGTFVSSTGLPIGTTYKYAKPTFSRTIKITGSVSLSSPTCNCRTDTLSTFNSAKGKYKSAINGVCDSVGDAEPQDIHMNDVVSDNSNVTCRNAACTSTSTSNYGRASLAPLNYLFGKSMEIPAAGVTSMSAIYQLESPYTVTAVAPKVELAFGTKQALFADSFTDTTAKCVVDTYYPKVRVKITN